ncbi:MAG: AIR synthase-related protein [Clostridia bacterium]|nr:AIR synthase-related protein [Clostridia bacterium]
MQAESYLSRGVSPTKEDVHKAIKSQSKGIFPGAFCKILEDHIGDPEYCSAMHADGAGTKSTLAYIYYKENGDASVFRGISQDSLVMNVDDLLCIGAVENFIVSNTIGRNAHRVDAAILKELIEGYSSFADDMAKYNVHMIMAGGETADIGDLVSTVVVDSTIYVRLPRKNVISCENIRPGNVIVGLSSSGKAIYEDSENSGIGSNGLTAARHVVLCKDYAQRYPETFSNTIDFHKVYCGKYRFEDLLPGSTQTVGQALLSPTRTYAPVVKEVLSKYFNSIHGMIHCTGGGQVKCKSFGKKLHYIKDNLFKTPPIFELIKNESDIKPKEMYQIFNMGHRMEFYCDPEAANEIIGVAKKYNIDAKIVGRVEENTAGDGNKVTIMSDNNVFEYV